MKHRVCISGMELPDGTDGLKDLKQLLGLVAGLMAWVM